jgi:hypothetical protein
MGKQVIEAADYHDDPSICTAQWTNPNLYSITDCQRPTGKDSKQNLQLKATRIVNDLQTDPPLSNVKKH